MVSGSGVGGVGDYEDPNKSEDIKEQVEATPEIQEAALSLEKATLKPEVKVETERDFKESEDLEVAFTAVVDVVPENTEQVSATPITLPKEDPDGIPDSTSEVSATPITLPKEDPDGINDPQAEVSATPITLPKEDPDGIQTAASASAADQVNLDGKGGDDPELVMVSTDGQSDEPQIDWGQDDVEQAGDLRQPSKEGDGPGSDMRDANRTGAEGYLGEMDTPGIDLPAGAEIPDMMDGKGGGMKPGELGGPDVGTDQMGEAAGLAGAAAPGADGRISADDENTTPPPPPPPAEDDSDPGTGTTSSDSGDDAGEGKGESAGKGPERGKKIATVKLTTGLLWRRLTSWVSDTGPDKPEFNAVAGIRGYDPEGPVEYVGETDYTLGGLVDSPIPDVSPLDGGNPGDTLTQPVDDESSHRPPPTELNPGSNVDPYAQYTGEEQSGAPLGVTPDDLDPDGSLIDPPEVSFGGDEGTFINTDSSSNRNDEEELAADGLESSDPASMDGKGGD